MKISEEIFYLQSNFGKHDQVVYEKHIFWVFRENKKSTRYVCSHKQKIKCNAMITIENNKVKYKTEHNNHIRLTNEEVKCFKRRQELKKGNKETLLK